jgi:hypothetical protein
LGITARRHPESLPDLSDLKVKSAVFFLMGDSAARAGAAFILCA